MTDPERDLRDMMQRTADGVRHVPQPSPGLVRRARLRRARTAALAGAAALALVVGGFAGAGSLSGDDAAPVQPADETEQETEAFGPRIGLLDGEVTFRAAKPWWEDPHEYRMIRKAPMGPASLLWLSDPSAAFLVIADPAPLQSCSRAGVTAVSAEVLAGAIGDNPGLSSTDPVAERVAGVDALRLDVAPVEGASTCRGSGVEGPPPTAAPDVGVAVITGTRKTALGPSPAFVVEADKRMRLYLLDLPEGAARSLAIVIGAAEADFNAAVDAARPILDSFEVHGS